MSLSLPSVVDPLMARQLGACIKDRAYDGSKTLNLDLWMAFSDWQLDLRGEHIAQEYVA